MDNLINQKILNQKFTNRHLFVTILFLFISSYVLASNDFQHWNSEGIEMMLSRRWKAGAREEFRFENNGGSLYHYFSEIELKYILNKNFEFSVDYRHINEKKHEDWKLEYRPHINGALKLNWRGFAVGDRSRLEYRGWRDKKNTWRYRNKLSVDFLALGKRFHAQPFIAYEMFFNIDERAWTRDRFYLGIVVKVCRNLRGEIYYLLQSTRNRSLKNYHIIGTNIKLVI